MLNELEIKNVSQTKALNLSLSSIQTQDNIKVSIPPNDSFLTKITKEGVRKMSVSTSGESTNFWEGIVPVNISNAILINPDNKSVIYNNHHLVSINKNIGEDNSAYIVLIVLIVLAIIGFWLYKKRK